MAEVVEAKVRQASPAPEPVPRQPEAVRGDREGSCFVVAMSLSSYHLSSFGRQRYLS